MYSPSRATSPHSDEEAESKREAPASTTSTSSKPLEPALKPGKVLGSDQAKKRLQAFARYHEKYFWLVHSTNKGVARRLVRRGRLLKCFKRTKKQKLRWCLSDTGLYSKCPVVAGKRRPGEEKTDYCDQLEGAFIGGRQHLLLHPGHGEHHEGGDGEQGVG